MVVDIALSHRMRLLMGSQVRALGEPPVALRPGAHVRLLSGVRAQMRSQIEIQGKALVADVALVGLLASVDQLVTFKLGVVEETFAAALHGTDVSALCVRYLMLAVGALITECL